MAILNAAQLLELRQAMAVTPNGAGVTWTKAQVNAALQAMEDWFEGQRTAIGVAIEAAAPGIFTNAQKKRIGKYWLLQKTGRE